MGQPRVQMMTRCWIPDVARELMNILGRTYAKAYHRVVRTIPRARAVVQGTSLSETVFTHLAFTLSEFGGLPVRPSDTN